MGMAWNNGYDAHNKGLHLNDNPYGVWLLGYHLWREGWLHAYNACEHFDMMFVG